MDEIGDNDLASMANCDGTIGVLAMIGLGESRRPEPIQYTNRESFS
jgi:hypothetical protein